MQDTPFKFSIHLISSLSRRINWDIKVVSFVIFSSLHSVSVLLVHLYAHIKRQVKVLILEFYNSSICCFSYWKKEKEKKKTTSQAELKGASIKGPQKRGAATVLFFPNHQREWRTRSRHGSCHERQIHQHICFLLCPFCSKRLHRSPLRAVT